jgi:hypothetical protein
MFSYKSRAVEFVLICQGLRENKWVKGGHFSIKAPYAAEPLKRSVVRPDEAVPIVLIG